MNYLTVSTKDVRHIVKATFPSYKRRQVVIKTSETVTFHDLNWSGGSRSEYRACSVDGKPIDSRVNMNGPAPWANPFEGKQITLPVGAVIVEGGYFCGKTSMLYIHVHPENMPKFLTA